MDAVKAELIAQGLADCIVYDLRHRYIEELYWPRDVYRIFYHLGRLKAVLCERFEKVKQELYDAIVGSISDFDDFDEERFREKVEGGLWCGGFRQLPTRMGRHSIHPGFVAEIIAVEYMNELIYVEGSGWYAWDWDEEYWRQQPREAGIVGFIYERMRWRIAAWREAWAKGTGVEEVAEWIEELESKLNDPIWLKKVEKLLAMVPHFEMRRDYIPLRAPRVS
jgi:hypothetical protein